MIGATRAAVAASSAIAFDPAFHLYHVDGVQTISVTQVLRESGLVDYGHIPNGAGVLARKAALGRAVHEATHYLDEGDLDWSTVDPAVLPYLDAYRRMLDETSFVPILVEFRVYHPAFRYCGTLDKIGRIARAPFAVLLDLKIGDPALACTNAQTAAYEDAYLAAPDPRVLGPRLERWSVQLKDDGTYRLTKYTDYRDRELFRAALLLARYKRKGGH